MISHSDPLRPQHNIYDFGIDVGHSAHSQEAVQLDSVDGASDDDAMNPGEAMPQPTEDADPQEASDDGALGKGFDIDAGKSRLTDGEADARYPAPPLPHEQARPGRATPTGGSSQPNPTQQRDDCEA